MPLTQSRNPPSIVSQLIISAFSTGSALLKSQFVTSNEIKGCKITEEARSLAAPFLFDYKLAFKHMSKTQETSLVIGATPEFIARRILLVRGQKVMLDSELAELYQVPTMRLNEQVKRNASRFPPDFMFQLAKGESHLLTSQIAISKEGRGGRRHLPYVFTELGIAMLSSVLNSDRAVQMNIYIMRAFVKLRDMLATHADLAEKIGELEKGQREHAEQISAVSSVLKQMLVDQTNPKDAIGFQVD